MSRNFDVLLRAEKQAGLFRVGECGTPLRQASVVQETFTARPSPVRIDSNVREAEMKLVQRLFLLPGSEAPHVVVFCGAEPRSGTTGICARAGENLMSQTGLPVCLVDGNMDRPSLHCYFGMDKFPGLAESVVETAPICDFLHAVAGNLMLLSAGSSDKEARALWTSERLRARVTELRKQFSYVLIDAPPANSHVDAILWGQMADGAILIVESNATRRDVALKAKENLAAAKVKVLGAVLNNRIFAIPESVYRKL